MRPLFSENKFFKLMPDNKYITAFCTVYKGAVFKDGANIFEQADAISGFSSSAYKHFQLNYPKFYKMDNLSKLGWLAAEVLLKDSFQHDDYCPEDLGVVLSNANSSLDDDIKYSESIKDTASPSLFVYTLPNIVIGEICIRNKFKGEQAFFISEGFDAEFIEQQVNYLLDKNLLQACICGWVDVLGEDYKATLFLVEKKQRGDSELFSATKMNAIFNGN
jgi:hypothetical protein